MGADSRWTDQYLDELSARGDPEADAVIEDLMKDGDVQSASNVLQTLIRNTQPPPGELPDSVRSYLLDARALPSWADPDLIRRGEGVFSQHGLQIGLALWCSALGEGYLHWRFAHILHLTARIESNMERRMLETQQMVMDVMAPGGLGPAGSGIASTLRVRLMHATIRHLVKERAKDDPTIWPTDWGEPISQEDMATTLMGFSVLMIDDLRMLGIPVSAADDAAFFHVWRVVGYFAGIDEDVLPANAEEGRELFQRERERYYKVTPQGIALEKALMDTLNGMAPAPMRHLPVAFIRFFIGDTYADQLQVPSRAKWRRRIFRRFIRIHRRMAWLIGESGLSAAAAPLTRSLLFSLSEKQRGGERAAFELPTELRQSWEVPESRD